MDLSLPEEQQILRDTFSQLFAEESSPDRVRAAESEGFDAALWKQLVETGALAIRVPEAAGGAGASLFDAVLLAEQVGRHLATGPILETIAVASALAPLDSPAAQKLVGEIVEGGRVASLALSPLSGPRVLVSGGAAVNVALALEGDVLIALEAPVDVRAMPSLGGAALAEWEVSAAGRIELARGEEAHAFYERARGEWQLLMAAALGGLGHRAVEIGAAYATERIQFDRPIGSFQAIAHPLADAVTAIEGGQVLLWRAIHAIAHEEPSAPWIGPLVYGWLAQAAPTAARVALHTHGGYGLSMEYDIQLFLRRAKTWALLAGDPGDAYVEAADRRWRDGRAALPDAGTMPIRFGLGEKAETFRGEVLGFLEGHPIDEGLRAKRHSFEGHDPAFHRALAGQGLLYASWPEEYGGQGRDPFESSALAQELERAGRTTYTIQTTRMVAETVMEFGHEDLKRDVLPQIASGEALCSLGYTEPASGSDVAAAQTRAVRDGDDWVIEGQKMFTSGADIGQYVFLLTRTDPDAPKHRGLTMFLVPLDTAGVDIQPIHTLSDERTNATYYSAVRLPDRYRVGEVNGGWSVIGYALHLEHSAGVAGGQQELEEMIAATVGWARSRERGEGCALDDPRVRERLGHAAAQSEVTESLALRGLWCGVTEQPNRGEGAMAATLKKVALVDVASDLMDLAAPDSVLSRGAERAVDGGALEFGYRLGTALAIYGGTKEILKSIVTQTALGMPRSRS